MKLISRLKAASCSHEKLRGHLREAFNTIATTQQGSEVHRSALLSMENIEAELASRGPSR
jgi:hypothetical protein